MAVDTGGSPTPRAGASFALGWLMAQLFGPLPRRPGAGTETHLPTVAELDVGHQVELAFVQLKDLLQPYPGLSGADLETAWEAPRHAGFTAAVTALHLQLLRQLGHDRQQLDAYQLGRALSDTCWLPDKEAGPDFFLREFGRYRLAVLQTWLAQASGALPALSAATVSRSLQNWQDWADINASGIRAGWATANRSVIAALRTQARAWQALLAGHGDTTGPTSLDAWIHAGESILRSARILMVTALRRFWPVAAILAAATGGLLYLAIADSSGTARVWTSLVTVAAALGVSGGSLRVAAKRAAGGLEQDIVRTATLDARAWSITWLPTLPQTRLQQYRLASRGVAVPQARTALDPPPSLPPSPPAPPPLPQQQPQQPPPPPPAPAPAPQQQPQQPPPQQQQPPPQQPPPAPAPPTEQPPTQQQ